MYVLSMHKSTLEKLAIFVHKIIIVSYCKFVGTFYIGGICNVL